MRARRSERGFTLAEVLVATFIVATAIAALQGVATSAMASAAETNKVRVMNLLLRQKAGEVFSGAETFGSGTFEDFPGYEWSMAEQEVQVSADPPAAVRFVTVRVYLPGTVESGEAEDAPGEVRLTTFLDPPNEKLEPPK